MVKPALIITAVALLVTAPTAYADDASYVLYLDDHGVYYSSITDVIDMGKLACRGLRQGVPPGVIVNAIADNGDFPTYDAAIIVLSATKNMCTDQYPPTGVKNALPQGISLQGER